MPPFGTCFQSKVGPGYALQAARTELSGGLFAGPGVTVVWPASRSLTPMRAPGYRYFVRLGTSWPKWRQQ
jgi:hypothetical protein